MKAIKEEPNTPNVIVWPKGFKDSSDIKNNFNSEDRSDNKTSKQLFNDNDDNSNNSNNLFWIKIEKYFFIFCGSSLWIFVVIKLLKYLKFPFHRHYWEVVCMIIIPILFIIILINLLDRQLAIQKKSD